MHVAKKHILCTTQYVWCASNGWVMCERQRREEGKDCFVYLQCSSGKLSPERWKEKKAFRGFTRTFRPQGNFASDTVLVIKNRKKRHITYKTVVLNQDDAAFLGNTAFWFLWQGGQEMHQVNASIYSQGLQPFYEEGAACSMLSFVFNKYPADFGSHWEMSVR